MVEVGHRGGMGTSPLYLVTFDFWSVERHARDLRRSGDPLFFSFFFPFVNLLFDFTVGEEENR